MDQPPRSTPPDVEKAVSEDARQLLERIKSYLSASAVDPASARQREDPSALIEALRELRRGGGR